MHRQRYFCLSFAAVDLQHHVWRRQHPEQQQHIMPHFHRSLQLLLQQFHIHASVDAIQPRIPLRRSPCFPKHRPPCSSMGHDVSARPQSDAERIYQWRHVVDRKFKLRQQPLSWSKCLNQLCFRFVNACVNFHSSRDECAAFLLSDALAFKHHNTTSIPSLHATGFRFMRGHTHQRH